MLIGDEGVVVNMVLIFGIICGIFLVGLVRVKYFLES